MYPVHLLHASWLSWQYCILQVTCMVLGLFDSKFHIMVLGLFNNVSCRFHILFFGLFNNVSCKVHISFLDRSIMYHASFVYGSRTIQYCIMRVPL